MLKLIFWGTPQFAVPALQRLLGEPELTVVGVVTQPDKRRGRGSQMNPSPIKQVAVAHSLTVWQPTRVKKDAQTLAELQSCCADVFVVVAYGQILSPEILEMPRLGCINAHGSLLPHYRGAAPIQWSIFNGEAVTGVTTMQMDVGMDTGPMLLKQSIEIGLLEDAAEVGRRLAEVSAELLVQTLLKLSRGDIKPVLQDEVVASYAPLLKKSDFLIHWASSAIDIHNQVRAFVPNGVAQFRGQPLKILKTAPLGLQWQAALAPELQVLSKALMGQDHSALGAGAVIDLAKAHGPVIQTGAGPLLLQLVQMAGKRPQSGWDFANGLRLQRGDYFENGILIGQ